MHSLLDAVSTVAIQRADGQASDDGWNRAGARVADQSAERADGRHGESRMFRLRARRFQSATLVSFSPGTCCVALEDGLTITTRVGYAIVAAKVTVE